MKGGCEPRSTKVASRRICCVYDMEPGTENRFLMVKLLDTHILESLSKWRTRSISSVWLRVPECRMRCKEVTLARRPDGAPSAQDFEVKEVEFDANLGEDEALLQLQVLSVDPYMRFRMSDGPNDERFPTLALGQTLDLAAMAKVVASKNPGLHVGDFVSGIMIAREFIKVGSNAQVRKVVPEEGVPLFHYLGPLGMAGLTAWIGLELIGQPKEGEQVFVSAASGSVGILVGQLAKCKGCRVVGSAGTDEKVRSLKEELGFDDAFNYKAEQDWDGVLKRMFPSGIDIYFDNVGGRMLDTVLPHMNKFGRIPVCGMISQYNKPTAEREGVRNLLSILWKELSMKGFLCVTYLDKLPDFMSYMTPLLKQGKIKYKEHITRGIDNYGAAFTALFKGDNIGKSLLLL